MNSFQFGQGLNADQEIGQVSFDVCPVNILDKINLCLGSNIVDLVVTILYFLE